MLRQEAPHPVREVRPLVPRPRLAAEQEPKVEPEPGLLPPRAAPAPVAAAPRGCARRLAHEGGGVAAAPRRGTGGGGGEGARGGGVVVWNLEDAGISRLVPGPRRTVLELLER